MGQCESERTSQLGRVLRAAALALLLGLLALPGAAQALVLAQWTFDTEPAGTCNNNPNPSTDVMGNAVADAGSGLRCPPSSPRNFPAGNPGRAWSYDNWHQGSSLSTDDYFGLTVDFSAFSSPDLQFSFDERRSGAGPRRFEIRYSTDGVNFSTAAGPVSIPNNTRWRSRSFDLSGLNSNIGGQSAVRFRIYGYGATGNTGTWRIDNVTFFLNNPTAVVLGDVGLVTAGVDEVLDGLGAADMSLEGLRGLLAVWRPAAAQALDGAGREALLDALWDYLDADGDGRVVLFRWETLEQRGTLGFFVERRAGDAWTRIHAELLPALVAAPMGAQYWMVDPGAHTGEVHEYRLIEVEARGTKREYGPFALDLDE